MNSSVFSRMMNQPYSRSYANIPGMQMPQQQNPSPSGKFIFPPRPVAQPITPPPGTIPTGPPFINPLDPNPSPGSDAGGGIAAGSGNPGIAAAPSFSDGPSGIGGSAGTDGGPSDGSGVGAY